MNIDFFTLTAQIINLLILLFLLRRFLYLPVLKAVTNRQRAVASELRRAERTQRRAEEAEKACKLKMQEIDDEKQMILDAARNEAQKLFEKLSADNYLEAQKERKLWQERFLSEQKNFETAVQQLIVEYFNKFADKAISQMADVSLNDLIVHRFKDQIEHLNVKEKNEFSAAYKTKKQIIVQTADALTTEEQSELQNFLKRQLALPDKIKFVFEENKELISGISLQADEQLISWNLESYLQDFRRNLSDEIMQLLNRGYK